MSRFARLGDRNDQNEFDVASIESNVSARRVEGLERFLAERYLEDYAADAHAWCADMGARLLEEVVEELTTLADDLQLKPLEKKRLLGPPRARSEHELALCSQPKDDAETQSTVTATEMDVSELETETQEAEAEAEPLDAEWSTVAKKAVVKKSKAQAPKPEEPKMQKPLLKEPRTVTVNVPEERVKVLLGKAAENLRQIEAQCGVRISVPKTGALRAVVIRGPTAQARADAQAALALAFEEAAAFARAEAYDQRERSAFDAVAKEQYMVVRKASRTETTVEVHEAQVPALLGEKGAAVRKLEEKSGARISVPREGVRREVVVRGAAESVATALELIAAALPAVTEVTVRSWQVGALLGYGGATVRDIEQTTGTRITMPREGEVRKAVISGPTEAVAKAKAMALDAISYAVRPRKDLKDAKDRSDAKEAPAAIPKRLQGAHGLIRGQGDRPLRR